MKRPVSTGSARLAIALGGLVSSHLACASDLNLGRNHDADEGAGGGLVNPIGSAAHGGNGAGTGSNGPGGAAAAECPAGTSSCAVALAAGSNHTCAITGAKGLLCWGVDDMEQLGNGPNAGQSNVPYPVADLGSGVRAMGADWINSCGTTEDGEVYRWGYDSLSAQTLEAPVHDLDFSAVRHAACGDGHICVVTMAGAVLCKGQNDWGQLGNGDPDGVTSDTPVPVSGLDSGVLALVTRDRRNCVITASSAALCWGKEGANGLVDVPLPVPGLGSGVTDIAVDFHACAVANGAAVCWGSNEDGQLGDETYEDRTAPVPVKTLGAQVVAVAVGAGHSCALTAAGAVSCWGANGHGQLGNGTKEPSPVPVAVNGLGSGVTAIAANGSHTCAIAAGGHVLCWGKNGSGQLGNGLRDDSSVPTPVTGL